MICWDKFIMRKIKYTPSFTNMNFDTFEKAKCYPQYSGQREGIARKNS